MLTKPRIAAVFAAVVLLVAGLAWYLAQHAGPVADGSHRPVIERPGSSQPRPPEPGPPLPVPVLSSAPPSVPAAPVTAPAPLPGPTAAPAPAAANRPVATPAMSAAASAPASAPPAPSETVDAGAVAIDIDQVGLMLRDYRTRMGDNPVGTNAEIMKSVMGGNPKGAILGPPEGQHLNAKGELVDRWGTPYFFHQMSATDMQISSAGPDKTFGTDDDIKP